MKDKKIAQLGMDPATASHRLLKDLLFKLAIDAGHKCHHCRGDLTRETLSIEHKQPWLDSDDPKSLFFDLENVAFSHKACNFRNATRVKVYDSDTARWKAHHVRLTEKRRELVAAGVKVPRSRHMPPRITPADGR
jgi:hypothetical protein